jgi:hypothetical protein
MREKTGPSALYSNNIFAPFLLFKKNFKGKRFLFLRDKMTLFKKPKLCLQSTDDTRLPSYGFLKKQSESFQLVDDFFFSFTTNKRLPSGVMHLEPDALVFFGPPPCGYDSPVSPQKCLLFMKNQDTGE